MAHVLNLPQGWNSNFQQIGSLRDSESEGGWSKINWHGFIFVAYPVHALFLKARVRTGASTVNVIITDKEHCENAGGSEMAGREDAVLPSKWVAGISVLGVVKRVRNTSLLEPRDRERHTASAQAARSASVHQFADQSRGFGAKSIFRAACPDSGRAPRIAVQRYQARVELSVANGRSVFVWRSLTKNRIAGRLSFFKLLHAQTQPNPNSETCGRKGGQITADGCFNAPSCSTATAAITDWRPRSGSHSNLPVDLEGTARRPSLTFYVAVFCYGINYLSFPWPYAAGF
ncbi:hypothetical protein DFH09DRAFT_1093336 [Mycena vulgaris]|nr:hypothetical protein DFH09DRAFT_1093336 [Mycena vulgaris]